MSPQSTARRSSPDSSSIMLRPISPRPPSGRMRTLGSIAGSLGAPAGALAGMTRSVIPGGSVSRGLGGAQKAGRAPTTVSVRLGAAERVGEARELFQREGLRAPRAVDPGPVEGLPDARGAAEAAAAERVGERLPPLAERRAHEVGE